MSLTSHILDTPDQDQAIYEQLLIDAENELNDQEHIKHCPKCSCNKECLI